MKRMLSPRNLTLSAVGALLFLVSVPRVHQLALQDNQRDAQSAAKALLTASRTGEVSITDTRQLAETLEERLRDVRYHEASGLIQRHGYLFEVSSTVRGEEVVRAWPVAHGETGLSAYLIGPETALMVHPNAEAAWSGKASPRPTGLERGWHETGDAR